MAVCACDATTRGKRNHSERSEGNANHGYSSVTGTIVFEVTFVPLFAVALGIPPAESLCAFGLDLVADFLTGT